MMNPTPESSQPPENPAQGPQPQTVRVYFQDKVKKPTVTYVLLAVTVVLFCLQLLSESLLGQNIDLPFLIGGKINELILQGQVWRLITPVFLHGNLLHIGFNMYALFSIGPTLEKYYGHGRFLLLYLLAGYTGNVLSFILSPNPSLGASTAIFGLVAAEAVFIFRNRKLFGDRAVSMLINLGVIIAVNLLLGLQPGIDNWGHLGGLAGGVIFAWVAGPIFKVGIGEKGYELKDSQASRETLWGAILTFGIFTAAVIGRFIAG